VWSYTSTPQYVFMAWCLVKHRDNFTFTFMLRGRDGRVRFPAEPRIFFFRHSFQTGSGAHPTMVTRGLSRGVKRPGRVVDRSFPSSAEVKNSWT
jgi:hypothetical protein